MTSMDGMDSDLYGDDKPDSKESPKSVDEQESMDPEALVSMKVLTGKHGPPEVGDEIVVKVKEIHGDQAVISYAPEKPGEGEEESEGESDDMETLNKTY